MVFLSHALGRWNTDIPRGDPQPKDAGGGKIKPKTKGSSSRPPTLYPWSPLSQMGREPG